LSDGEVKKDKQQHRVIINNNALPSFNDEKVTKVYDLRTKKPALNNEK
jgi:hypothetical protein